MGHQQTLTNVFLKTIDGGAIMYQKQKTRDYFLHAVLVPMLRDPAY